jgi:hypothetical protein
LSRVKFSRPAFQPFFFARHKAEEPVSDHAFISFGGATGLATTHRFGHKAAMIFPADIRLSSADARAPNQFSGLAFADQGHPRAALDVAIAG